MWDKSGLASYIALEARVPTDHPLRQIRGLLCDPLKEVSQGLGHRYASEGRPSVPLEPSLSALLLQVPYGIRSERQLIEQLNHNLLFRWFVELLPDEPTWDATTFTESWKRPQRGEVFRKFMSKLLGHPKVRSPLSDDHFSVDGTLIEAWASQKSFHPKDGSGGDGADFHGQQRTNEAHTARRSRTAGSTAKPPGASPR